MKTRYLLYATGSLLLAALPARAGSRTGASGAITIPADTVDGGGGKSTAGTGDSAITVTASMGGIGGTVSTGTTANQQGYIPQIMPAPGPSGYDLWASQNIPAGKDASFTGDWNGDGVLNAVAYVFGNTRIEPVGGQPVGTGKIPAPPAIPADVNVYLEWTRGSSGLSTWEQIVRWENGNAPVFDPNYTSFTANYVVDVGGPSPFFYRYRITRR